MGMIGEAVVDVYVCVELVDSIEFFVAAASKVILAVESGRCFFIGSLTAQIAGAGEDVRGGGVASVARIGRYLVLSCAWHAGLAQLFEAVFCVAHLMHIDWYEGDVRRVAAFRQLGRFERFYLRFLAYDVKRGAFFARVGRGCDRVVERLVQHVHLTVAVRVKLARVLALGRFEIHLIGY